ncbi:MAG: methyltransferase family protein [bacterium]
MKITKILIGRLVSIIVASCAIVVAGGGIAFLRRPMGIFYLVLSVVWWLLALVRRRGIPSTYDRKQRVIVITLGAVTVPLLIVVPPWEYAHFAGPIPRDGLLAWAGLVLFAAGITLQAAAMWTLRGFYTVRLGMQPGHRLVTSGPYCLVRHPGYLSYILSMMGVGLALSSLIGLGLAVLVMPFLLWRIRCEEEMLLAEFGDEYKTYMRQTKRLIPLIY